MLNFPCSIDDSRQVHIWAVLTELHEYGGRQKEEEGSKGEG